MSPCLAVRVQSLPALPQGPGVPRFSRPTCPVRPSASSRSVAPHSSRCSHSLLRGGLGACVRSAVLGLDCGGHSGLSSPETCSPRPGHGVGHEAVLWVPSMLVAPAWGLAPPAVQAVTGGAAPAGRSAPQRPLSPGSTSLARGLRRLMAAALWPASLRGQAACCLRGFPRRSPSCTGCMWRRTPLLWHLRVAALQTAFGKRSGAGQEARGPDDSAT